MRLKVLGAARQVTGSSYAVEADGVTALVDCGLYQERPFLARNWEPFPVPPGRIDGVLLTHAHLDHCGLLPRLVRQGFSGPVVTTAATADLLPIVLGDAARIQEEDAAAKKKRHAKEGRRGPHEEVPLYTTDDVERTLALVEVVPYGRIRKIGEGLSVLFHDAGHILGSAMIEVRSGSGSGARSLIFSGDIGQWNKPLVRDPSVFARADYVVMETTYGDRNHDDPKDVQSLLCDIVARTVASGGNVVIPTFAIERAQELLFHFSRLRHERCIPPVLVFLDSPMAVDVTGVFESHLESLDEETKALFRSGKRPFDFPGLKLIRTSEESKAINSIRGSCIIMAGSGMCTGGRIKQHLIRNISRPDSTILFVGFQAKETLGRHILEGASPVRILGETWPVRARIEKILGFSAHADRKGLFRWLDAFEAPPRRLFLTHGENATPLALAEDLRRDRSWQVSVPEYLEEFDLP